MSDELPQGWMTTPLATIAEARMGETILAKQLTPTGIPVFSAGAENNPWGFLENPRKPLGKGTVVVSARGSIGFPKIPKAERFASTQTTISLRFPDEELAAYGCLWLKTVNWSVLTKGVAIPMLTVGDINEIEVPLAPLAEQRRIVAKLEKVLGQVDACQWRLKKMPKLLKRFRQSILAAACSGRLTADWREENSTIETAEALFGRIKEKRLALAQSQKEKAQIAEVFDERNLRIDEGDVGLDEIPDSWFSCRIGAIGRVSNGSTPSRKQPEFWDGAIPWVSSGEVRNNVISETRERITKAGYEGSSVRLLPKGSVLIAMISEGKTRGQTAILNIEAAINQNIAAVVLDHGLVASEYLWRWFQLQYEATRERGGGSGPQALNCQRVRELPFILPPLAEQQEIVRRVEGLFALADQLEMRLAQARGQVAKLTLALLARAFAGQLVPQNPKDEPASALLERIKVRS